jgi:pyrimidine deaminase RibD-like protein
MHEDFMKLALVESMKALPACRPNPPVGCVLVMGNEVIAKGFTQGIGEMHAEAHALSQVEGNLEKITAYVTLEPCSFIGRTPSCATTLIQRNIGKVYVSVRDTDPRNNGKGIGMLENAGIKVTEGILSNEVSEFIGKYLNES